MRKHAQNLKTEMDLQNSRDEHYYVSEAEKEVPDKKGKSHRTTYKTDSKLPPAFHPESFQLNPTILTTTDHLFNAEGELCGVFFVYFGGKQRCLDIKPDSRFRVRSGQYLGNHMQELRIESGLSCMQGQHPNSYLITSAK